MFYIFISFSALMFAVSALYLTIFFKSREKVMQFWGFSCIAHSIGLILFILYDASGNDLLLESRKIADMFGLLLLLFGAYGFMHVKIPTYWYRFSLYMLLLAAICMSYGFELLSFYLPISIYQLILTVSICYNIFTRWNISRFEKYVTASVFFSWGIMKSAAFIGEMLTDSNEIFCLTELMLYCILTSCIFITYITHLNAKGLFVDRIYQSIIENMNSASFYYRIKPAPSFAYMSPHITELTGYPPEAFYTDYTLIFRLATEPFAGDITDIFDNRLRRTEYPVLELYRKDGETFWCEFSSNFIRNEEGENIGMVGTLRDVTNMKSVQVEQVGAIRQRNILLSYISHELKTPITSIAGFLTAVQDGTMSSENDKREAMDIITSKVMTLKKLIDDLDQLTKMESNQFTFDFESVLVRDLVEFLISRNIPDAEAQGFTVRLTSDMKILEKYYIVADMERVNQVFTNLVTNAIKYSHENRIIDMRFTVDERGEYFMAFVTDYGIGIPDHQLTHIFDRFYRVDYNKRSHTGNRGLGLTLSKEIIEAHNGEIYVDSTEGSGSTFSFTIPLYTEA